MKHLNTKTLLATSVASLITANTFAADYNTVGWTYESAPLSVNRGYTDLIFGEKDRNNWGPYSTEEKDKRRLCLSMPISWKNTQSFCGTKHYPVHPTHPRYKAPAPRPKGKVDFFGDPIP